MMEEIFEFLFVFVFIGITYALGWWLRGKYEKEKISKRNTTIS